MLILCWLHCGCHGFLPTAEIDVFLSDAPPTLSKYTLMASQASFGDYPPMKGLRHDDLNGGELLWRLERPPTDNPDLCSPPPSTGMVAMTTTTTTTTVDDYTNNKETIMMLVPRGQCTFETKAFHAQLLGAKGVVIYGTLASRYSLNTTARTNSVQDIVWPMRLDDYDCDKGRAMIPEAALSFDPLPYNANQNDAVLSQETSENLCLQKSPNFLQDCPSKACLLTGNKFVDGGENSDQGQSSWEACCAWDLHIWLPRDEAFHTGTTPSKVVTIPTVYITLREGQRLLRDMAANSIVRIVLYQRWRPRYSPSAPLIWLLAVVVAAVAAHLSAHDYHSKLRRVLRAKARGLPSDHEEDNPDPSLPRRSTQPQQPEETLELSAWHSVVFVVMASCSLLVLFYFKIYGFVKVMYAFGCSKALGTILLAPIIHRVMKYGRISNPVLWDIQMEDIGEITLRDILAYLSSFSMGAVWLYMAFTNYHPETITYFWVMQDIFGACMCVMFLQVVKLNSIRVASILLIVAFFYDIFFVFVSPLIFSKSVMLDVATSGGPPPNPEWCEKYPDDPISCQQRGNPLPMLFTIPRIADYQGGANLLGLGDVVLPGLLISFAARLDAAKKLLGVMGGGNGSLGRSYACPEQRYCGSTCWNGGYYFPLVIAYAVGLMMANAAVYLMNMGQPALLYLVPCCLGMVVFIGWRRGELSDLWEGPRVIRAGDIVCYGEALSDTTTSSMRHAPLPQDEYDDNGHERNPNRGTQNDVLAVPSATEDQTTENNK